MYDFGGKTRLQKRGGPIGARLTMACSRIVMLSWGKQYLEILREAKLQVSLMKIYVDDVRQVTTPLRMGSRFSVEEKRIVETGEAYEEDEKLKAEGESSEARRARILIPAMNSINPDLSFTVELAEDFEDKRLPTLDCKLWFNKDWTINHTYYEKPMKSQMMIPARSAMPERQRMNILSNDLVRRLSNIKLEQVEEGEIERVVNQYTSQLRTSGYERRKCREIVVSGVLGWKRKIERRKEQGAGFYRGAASTLRLRMRKKLTDKVTWYKDKTMDIGMEEQVEDKKGGKKRKAEDVGGRDARNSKKRKDGEAKAVMFCPYTKGSELAKKLRDAEERLEPLSGFRIKIVEEVGEKVRDILHSSNPWRGEDCRREGCWLCETKQMMEKFKKQDCTKRNLVYET